MLVKEDISRTSKDCEVNLENTSAIIMRLTWDIAEAESRGGMCKRGIHDDF